MDLELTGEIFHWRGPAPYLFVRVPDDVAAALHDVSSQVTYGWGMIPVVGRIGDTVWETSLFPKDGGYLVPIKVAVQRAEGVEVGDTVDVRLTVQGPV